MKLFADTDFLYLGLITLCSILMLYRLSQKKKKKSTTHSVRDQDSSPNTPTLRSQSAKKGEEIATPMTVALQKRKMDDGGEINTSKNSSLYVDAPKMSITNWPEMRSYSIIPKQGQVSDSLAIDLIHGYYATVSYTDALIGEILNELKKQELDKNTVVVFVSDHGYNLQEHTQWAKFTNYNTSTQVPLIIYNPFSKAKGTTNALTALVDVYPTLAEICGIEVPKKQLDGTSLVSILNNPNLEGKKHVFIKKGNGFTLKTKDFCNNISRNKRIVHPRCSHRNTV